MELDKEQKKAVEATEGTVCIVAGPGSGKTHTIVEQIAHMVEKKGVAPENILAITFTNKAADEMRSRVEKWLAGDELPTIGTFHSLALDILKEHGCKIGLAEDFKILSESEQKKIVKELLKKHESLDLKVKDALLLLSKAKSGGEKNSGTDNPIFAAFADDYKKELTARRKLDFDDLLIHTLELFQKHTDVLSSYQKKFRYIMVDEYQDTSPVQANILRALAAESKNICIIGDPNQAIYGFRGATCGNFLSFKNQYPDAVTIKLAKNYRSTSAIIATSDALIGRKKKIKNDFKEAPVSVISCDSPQLEASYITKTIEQLIGGIDFLNVGEDHGKTYYLSDIAVLYRLNAVGKTLEKRFAQSGIPYHFFGGVNFFERPEIKKIIERLETLPQSGTLSEQIKKAIEKLGLKKALDDGTQQGEAKYNRVLELENIVRSYDNLSAQEAREKFFEEVELSRADDDHSPLQESVTLMTAHSSKGLEFPVVFIAGVEDALFPYCKDGEENTEHVQEERRLLYVAMTRAKERLYITYAKDRMLFGKTANITPSRFLKAIPEELIQKKEIKRKPPKKRSPQNNLF